MATVSRRPCSKCGKNRAEKFYTSPRGRVCSFCRKATARHNSRNSRLQTNYGISQDEYNAMYQAQNGGCAICGGKRKVLDVDHDHALERQGLPMRLTVRGLICKRCNKVLAEVRDDVDLLEELAAYLESPPAREFLEAS